MSNTQTSKSYLIAAIKSLPSDNSLVETRQYMLTALRRLEDIEDKRAKRASQSLAMQNESIDKLKIIPTLNQFDAQQAISVIDKMIAEEKANLAAIQKRRQGTPQDDEFLLDG
jgi:hypothetical protein